MSVSENKALKDYEFKLYPIAKALAWRHKLALDEVEDLIQEGRLAIVTSARRATSYHWPYFHRNIVGRMQHWLRDNRRLIRIPAWMQEEPGDKNLPYALLDCNCTTLNYLDGEERDEDGS